VVGGKNLGRRHDPLVRLVGTMVAPSYGLLEDLGVIEGY
jgi:hypothetical protein